MSAAMVEPTTFTRRRARATRTPGRADVRQDLEGLRAVAVLGVVIYHLRPRWLPGGFAGVDVFFVLSGYFITALLLREVARTGRVDLIRFWARRARRLLPASALVIVLTIAAGYAMTNALESQRIARDGLLAAVFGMNWGAAYQGTQYLQDPRPSPLVHFWSLGVEEQFYAVWPVLLLGLALLARAVRPLTVPRTLIAVATAGGVASFALALAQTEPANSYAYFGTLERVWQLALGGVLAAGAARLARLPQWLLASSRWLGVGLVVGFYVLAGLDVVYPGRKSLVPAVGAALIIAAGTPLWRRWDPLTRLLCSPPAQLGGRYSYSWYLWHYPPLVLLPIYLDRPLRVRELGACAVATFLAAALTFHLLENPVRANSWLAARRGLRSLALGAALVLLGVGAAQVSAAASRHDADHTQVADRYGHVLVPQPAEAAAELPPPYADGCFEAYHDGLAKECRYLPDTGHGDVVLVGDSHAAVWFPATLEIARAHQWGMRFWGRNSCPFADITKRTDGPYTKCDTWRTDVVNRLVRDRPSLVVVTSLDSVLPPFYARTAAGRVTNHLVTGRVARQLWEDGMARNLAILRKAGIRVLVIHDTPGYLHAQSAPDCVLAHPDDLTACSAPESSAMPGAPDDLEAARRVGGVSTIDFTDHFCHGGRCYQVIGATLAYRDYNHLTRAMTRRLQPAYERVAVATMAGAVQNVVA